MNPNALPLGKDALRAMYPEYDGKRMSESMPQARWIFLLYGNLCSLCRDRNAFVAADNLWYPVEGRPDVRQAPDVYVAFGRPKGDRGSYMQWLEGGLPLTVVFEILSPMSTTEEMDAKFAFYEEYGVEEYYTYDPHRNHLKIFTRGQSKLCPVDDIATFSSPRLGIGFELTKPEMSVYGPDGVQFLSFADSSARSRAERRESELFRQMAEGSSLSEEDAGRVTDYTKRRAEDEARREEYANRRLARLAKLGRKARRGQATLEEVAELERLEDESL